ncbi:metal ABC transporter solute-binding protein, Zn/Mn family [Bifidobacterium thermophilum]|uniref:metal ABC transporter solute-binding protein, Zn/Mn family n=1 Tax=Bifidobacterium thermophilum TaxID=33905 RepID=UPI00047D9243|nr:zinc ABC transporter substrate-binding protein [Bifidobacterium thermophilum]MDW8485611.1 zinc ABC transporter substrate-binding protein [Bifidobacterium thermophilum]
MTATGTYRRIARAAACIAAAGLVAAMGACGSRESAGTASSNASGTLNVVASINQWGSVASEIGGSRVTVTSIINSTAVEAHDYEPTSADIAAISKADVIIVNGAGYDSWATKAASSTKAQVVNAAESGGKHDGDNPHVWFSAAVRTAAAKAIATAYQHSDAVHAEEYTKQLKAWQDKEKTLESAIAETKQRLDGKKYAATESVAAYLADDMGLTDATPAGYAQAVANESEPASGDVTAFSKLLQAGSVALLVVNTQESNATTKQLTTAAGQGGVRVVELTEQMPKQYSTLTDWMTALVASFATAGKA